MYSTSSPKFQRHATAAKPLYVARNSLASEAENSNIAMSALLTETEVSRRTPCQPGHASEVES